MVVLITDTEKVIIRIKLDVINTKILEIFKKYPNRSFKTNQLRTILEFEGIEIGYGSLARRLTTLVNFTVLTADKGPRVYSYKLAKEFQPKENPE
ncbi:MAG: hypothetical protein M1427_06575 [Candidatus Thermoplasmatota archaeon]|jgi:hypothetical protein|nr:hypothetical protein [Candidatus Thermoplasmatota archaeon]